jgi:hypothetical protein
MAVTVTISEVVVSGSVVVVTSSVVVVHSSVVVVVHFSVVLVVLVGQTVVVGHAGCTDVTLSSWLQGT